MEHTRIATSGLVAAQALAMAVESKPLFHPEVMRQQVRAFNLPEPVAAWQPKLQQWAELIGSGRADGFKEADDTLRDWLRVEWTGKDEGRMQNAEWGMQNWAWIALVGQTAPPRMPIPPPALSARQFGKV